MVSVVRSSIQTYLKISAAGIASAAAVAALGYYPTLRVAGADATGAMFAGIGVSLVAGWIGALPIGLHRQGDRLGKPQAVLLATTIRFIVALALSVSIILSDWFDRSVFGLWVGISYMAMLLAETICIVRVLEDGKTGGHAPVSAPLQEKHT